MPERDAQMLKYAEKFVHCLEDKNSKVIIERKYFYEIFQSYQDS